MAEVEGLTGVLSVTAGRITGPYMPVSNMWNLTFKWKKRNPSYMDTHVYASGKAAQISSCRLPCITVYVMLCLLLNRYIYIQTSVTSTKLTLAGTIHRVLKVVDRIDIIYGLFIKTCLDCILILIM